MSLFNLQKTNLENFKKENTLLINYFRRKYLLLKVERLFKKNALGGLLFVSIFSKKVLIMMVV